VAYIWHAGTKAGIVQDSLAACGFETRSQIIWAKNNFAIGRGHYHCKHEPCWYVVRKGSVLGRRPFSDDVALDRLLRAVAGFRFQIFVDLPQHAPADRE
jgi:hypothetical protein